MDVEALRKGIETSFRLAGIEDQAWLAEDIALSIEASLRSFGREFVLSPSEIDSIVEGVLSDAGFPDAASKYRGASSSSGQHGIPTDGRRLKSLIADVDGLAGDASLADLADRVAAALAAMEITHAPPSLILELARFFRFRGEGVSVGDNGAVAGGRKSSSTPWIVSSQSVLDRVSDAARSAMEAGVLEFFGVSAIFPEIKIGVDFGELARGAGLEPPVAEFALYPFLEEAGRVVADVAGVARRLMADAGVGMDGERAPLRLRAVSPAEFAVKWLCGGWPESAGCVAELLAEVAECAGGEVTLDVR